MYMNNIEMLMTVIDYIEEHLSKKLDLTSIADAVGYSKYHLHRMFKNTIGLSIHDYVQRRQLSEAAKYLVYTDRPIIEIALMAGYESQQAFTLVFKQMYKKSPYKYRCCQVFYPLQLRFYINEKNRTVITSDPLSNHITLATVSDITDWMDLVHLVVDGFPYLEENTYLYQLKQAIREQRSLLLQQDETIMGALIFDYENQHIEYLGIHPLYQKEQIILAFLDKLRREDHVKDISVTTFRAGDKADTGYRKAYQSLGFKEAELLMEFGYPTQKFILSYHEDHIENE